MSGSPVLDCPAFELSAIYVFASMSFFRHGPKNCMWDYSIEVQKHYIIVIFPCPGCREYDNEEGQPYGRSFFGIPK
jgi:hypothetical protein